MIDASPVLRSAAYDAIVFGTLLQSELLERHVPLQFVGEYRSKAAALRGRLADASPPIELVVPVREAALACPLVGLLVWQKAVQTLSALASIGYPSASVTALWIGREALREGRLRRVWRAIGLDPRVIGIEEATRLLPTSGAQFQRCGALLRFLREQNRLDLEMLGDVVLAALCVAEPGRLSLQGQDRASIHNALCSRLLGPRRARGTPPTALFLPWIRWPRVPHILVGDRQREISEKIIAALLAAPSRDDQNALVAGLTEAVERASGSRAPMATESFESVEAIAVRLGAWISGWTARFDPSHERSRRTSTR